MRGVPYALAVGSLMYAMVCTRPYIACVVGVVSWQRTLDLPVLQVYADADMAGDVNSRKSLLGYLLTFAGEQSHGSPDFSSVLLCLPLKQSIL